MVVYHCLSHKHRGHLGPTTVRFGLLAAWQRDNLKPFKSMEAKQAHILEQGDRVGAAVLEVPKGLGEGRVAWDAFAQRVQG